MPGKRVAAMDCFSGEQGRAEMLILVTSDGKLDMGALSSLPCEDSSISGFLLGRLVLLSIEIIQN